MRRQFFLVLFACQFALLSAANTSAQQTVQLLPDHFAGWTANGPAPFGAPSPSGASPWTETGPGGTKRSLQDPLYRETGAKWEELRTYTDGKSRVTVYVARFRDPSSAYELYTSLLRPSMSPSTVGRFTAVDESGLLALVGNIIVHVNLPRNVSTKDLQELTSIVAAQSDKTPLPPIRGYLPKEDLVSATQRYALGPEAFRAAAEAEGKPEIAGLTGAVGFAQGAEAMLAQYRRGRDTGVLLLIDYPTPQLAELHMRHLETALSEGAKTAGSVIERKGSLLSVVIGPSSPPYAESLRSAVNYETQVTWNEPSQTATDPPWAVVLYRIFVGTGVFMVMAVAFGVAFGGFRIFIKKLLPGKVFDRPEQMEVLQLGLSGNKINTRDLY